MHITTNRKPRHIVYGCELTEKERAEFDYLDDLESASFFRYKGNVYDLGEFMRAPESLALLGFDGYSSDSFFSGILVKYCEGFDSVIVARFTC